MRTVQLLKAWEDHNIGDIVTVDNNVAFGLVDSKIATYKIRKVERESKQEKVVESDDKMTKEMRADKRKSSSYRTK